MKYRIAIILTILLVITFFTGVYMKKDALDETQALSDTVSVSENDSSKVYNKVAVKIDEETFSVLVADTPDKRASGLSGREELLSGHGMLFVFDKPGNYPFWMKDMNFAIDILWINEHSEIIHILENVAPETYPTAFTSSEDALYVLEFPVGTVADSIEKGDRVIVAE